MCLKDQLKSQIALKTGTCNKIDCCATRLLWKKIKNSIDSVTSSITLKDIVDDYNEITLNKGVKHNE